MHEGSDPVERLDALIARAEGASRVRPALRELEDLLSAGYAAALRGEARMLHLAEARDDLLDGADVDARELRRVTGEHRALERAVARLRVALEPLQGDFVALGGATVHAS